MTCIKQIIIIGMLLLIPTVIGIMYNPEPKYAYGFGDDEVTIIVYRTNTKDKYHIEYSNTMIKPNWEKISRDFNVDNKGFILELPITNADSRGFYRIQRE